MKRVSFKIQKDFRREFKVAKTKRGRGEIEKEAAHVKRRR